MVTTFNVTLETRLSCMTHGCNLTIDNAWNKEIEKHPSYTVFNFAVRESRKYVQQISGVQDKLPKTLKDDCGTRPWRSYFMIHDSSNTSIEKVNAILRERQEQHRLYNIDPILLNDIVQLMSPFSMIFDKLDMANQPTLQNVVPNYYHMLNDT